MPVQLSSYVAKMQSFPHTATQNTHSVEEDTLRNLGLSRPPQDQLQFFKEILHFSTTTAFICWMFQSMSSNLCLILWLSVPNFRWLWTRMIRSTGTSKYFTFFSKTGLVHSFTVLRETHQTLWVGWGGVGLQPWLSSKAATLENKSITPAYTHLAQSWASHLEQRRVEGCYHTWLGKP